MSTRNPTTNERGNWIFWIQDYNASSFFEAFVRTAQDAESTCTHCRQLIYLDIVEGGGVPDWRTKDGDYGCGESPESGEEGCGSHEPRKLREEND